MAAAEEMLRERDLFPTVDAPAAVLKKSQGDHDRPNLLESMDTGIALGLVGDATAAREMFALYVERRGLQRGRDDWRSFTGFKGGVGESYTSVSSAASPATRRRDCELRPSDLSPLRRSRHGFLGRRSRC